MIKKHLHFILHENLTSHFLYIVYTFNYLYIFIIYCIGITVVPFDNSSNMRQHTRTLSDIVCILSLYMPKILTYLYSIKMKEAVWEIYCQTDKPPSASEPCTSFSACKGHSLLSESSYTFSCFLMSIQQLCPKQASLVQNALLSALRKNSKGRYSQGLHHKQFH